MQYSYIITAANSATQDLTFQTVVVFENSRGPRFTEILPQHKGGTCKQFKYFPKTETSPSSPSFLYLYLCLTSQSYLLPFYNMQLPQRRLSYMLQSGCNLQIIQPMGLLGPMPTIVCWLTFKISQGPRDILDRGFGDRIQSQVAPARSTPSLPDMPPLSVPTKCVMLLFHIQPLTTSH